MSEGSSPRFGRMIPAMVTPFDDGMEVDVDRAVALACNLVEHGADSLVVCATTGEGPTIEHDKKIELFTSISKAVHPKAQVIANVGSNNTAESVAFAKEVSHTGVDAVMAVDPYYNKPPQEGLYQHFMTIANAVDLPVILYNIPGRCGVNLLPETTLRLAHDCKNIVAVKEASGDLAQIKWIIDGAPEGFCVYSGDDAMTYDVMRLGGAGVITTTGNVAPAQMKELVSLCACGNFDAARERHEALLPLMKQLFITANPILIKKALAIAGFSVGGLRLPLIEATPKQSADLERVMRQVGIV